MKINVEPVTREDRVYKILESIAQADNEENKTYISFRNDNHYGMHGYIYSIIEPDAKLAEDIIHAVRQYKSRLVAEVNKFEEK